VNLNKLDTLRSYLKDLPGASEDMPFGPDVLVYKILEKRMFALLMWNQDPLSINLKCDPNQALILRAQYESITPGYHMNKQHWNTLILEGSIPQGALRSMLHASYILVASKLTKKERQKLEYLTGQPFEELVSSLE
jgi:predicted DNA-binding protein (MmcQ/YjbR family)